MVAKRLPESAAYLLNESQPISVQITAKFGRIKLRDASVKFDETRRFKNIGEINHGFDKFFAGRSYEITWVQKEMILKYLTDR